MAYPKITVNTGLAQEVISSDTLPIPSPNLSVLSGTTTARTANKLVDVEGCLLYVGSNEGVMDVAKSFVTVKVKTVAGSIVIFKNFPVGEYLPVQVLQLYTTGTDVAVENSCIAIW